MVAGVHAISNSERMALMHSRTVARTTLLLALSLGALGLGPGCAMVLRRGGDEIRRQQSGSEPFATGTDSRERNRGPWRAIVHSASHDAADGLVDGALDALDEPERKAQLQALGDGLETRLTNTSRKAGEGLVEGMNATLPRTRIALVELVEGLRNELGLDPEQTARTFMRGAFDEARVGVRELRPEVRGLAQDLVEVVRQAMDEALGPKLKDRVRDDLKPAIDELGVPQLAEDVGKRTALGFSAGMAEALAEDGSLGKVIDQRVERAKQTAGEAKDAVDEWLARGLLLAFVVAVIVLVLVVFWWLRERNERVEAERSRKAAAEAGERRERMLRLVASAIHRAGERDDLLAFREEIKRLSRDDDGREAAAALSQFLTLEGLKLDRPRVLP